MQVLGGRFVFSFTAYIERGVEVKLLFSYWDHTKPDMQFFMKSLMALTGLHRSHNNKIEAKFFKVPAFTPDQAQIPFARVNHNKYMVTDKHGFIGKNINIIRLTYQTKRLEKRFSICL